MPLEWPGRPFGPLNGELFMAANCAAFWGEGAQEDDIDRHVNQTALAMVLSAISLLLAALAIPLVFQETENTLWRLAATAPIAVGLVLVVVARSMLARHGAARKK